MPAHELCPPAVMRGRGQSSAVMPRAMRVGVIQSNYLPWRGYFEFIAQVDLFVFYDDVEFSKGSWRNRNKLKTKEGVKWMTVPVHRDGSDNTVLQTRINDDTDWRKKHLDLFTENYRRAGFFDEAFELLQNLLAARDATISALNTRTIGQLCDYLGIATPLAYDSEHEPEGKGTARLIDLLMKLGATTYLSGPSGRNYLDEGEFRRRGIALEYKTYDLAPYPQLWGEFVSEVSIVDLIANCGPACLTRIRSASPNLRV